MLTRRGFVKLVGGAAVIASVPACGDNQLLPSGLYLDDHQWATIDAATGVILPGTVTDPGAREAQVVRYIDRLLAAFDVFPPAIFAGGPASGRLPYPDAMGNRTTTFPATSFQSFQLLPRVVEIAWRMRLYGTAAIDGGDFNDHVLGAKAGLREIYTGGVHALDTAANEVSPSTKFIRLAAEDQAMAVDNVATRAPEFYQALVEHTLEGMFAAPEYGGNLYLQGWELADYDGDSVPLGHAFYDEAAQRYRDRVDQPTSGPIPGAVTESFDPEIIQLLTVAAIGSGGKRFF